jgi:hypothetical protein
MLGSLHAGTDVVDDLHLNTEFVLAVEDLHGLDGLGDGLAATDEHTIDIKGKDKGVGDGDVERWADGGLEAADTPSRAAGAQLGSAGSARALVVTDGVHGYPGFDNSLDEVAGGVVLLLLKRHDALICV